MRRKMLIMAIFALFISLFRIDVQGMEVDEDASRSTQLMHKISVDARLFDEGKTVQEEIPLEVTIRIDGQPYAGIAEVNGKGKRYVDAKKTQGVIAYTSWEWIDIDDIPVDAVLEVVDTNRSGFGTLEPIIQYTTGERPMYITFDLYKTVTKAFDVEVQWIGGPKEPLPLSLQLFKDGVKEGEAVTLENTTVYQWQDLEVTCGLNACQYHVAVQSMPANYRLSVETKENGAVLTLNYEIPKRDITVEAKWHGGPKEKPIIKVQLYRDGQPWGEPRDLVENRATWKDLEQTDTTGREIQYTVQEVTIPDGYESSVEGFVIHYTYVAPTTSITMTAEWQGDGDHPSILVQLYQNGEKYGDPVSLAASESSLTWHDLPKTDIDGQPFEYTVDEVQVPQGYRKEVSGLTILNVKLNPNMSATSSKPEMPAVQKPLEFLPASGHANVLRNAGMVSLIAGLGLLVGRYRRDKD